MPIFIKDNDSQCFSFKVYSFSLTLPAPDSINQGPLLEMFKELFYLINHCGIAELLHRKCSLLHNIYYTQRHEAMVCWSPGWRINRCNENHCSTTQFGVAWCKLFLWQTKWQISNQVKYPRSKFLLPRPTDWTKLAREKSAIQGINWPWPDEENRVKTFPMQPPTGTSWNRIP